MRTDAKKVIALAIAEQSFLAVTLSAIKYEKNIDTNYCLLY